MVDIARSIPHTVYMTDNVKSVVRQTVAVTAALGLVAAVIGVVVALVYVSTVALPLLVVALLAVGLFGKGHGKGPKARVPHMPHFGINWVKRPW